MLISFGIALVAIALAPWPTVRRHGGLVFFRLGRFGGSVYMARRPVGVTL